MFNTDLIKTKEKLTNEINLLNGEIESLNDKFSTLKRNLKNFELDMQVKEREFEIKLKTREDLLSERFKAEEKRLAETQKNQINEKNEKIKDLERKIDEMKNNFDAELEKNTLILKLDFEKKVLEEKSKVQNSYLDDVKKNEQEFYLKLKTELATLHSEGNFQTNFVRDFAEKMLTHKLEEKKITMVSNGNVGN
jgi:chromosome segregation ATPase